MVAGRGEGGGGLEALFFVHRPATSLSTLPALPAAAAEESLEVAHGTRCARKTALQHGGAGAVFVMAAAAAAAVVDGGSWQVCRGNGVLV